MDYILGGVSYSIASRIWNANKVPFYAKHDESNTKTDEFNTKLMDMECKKGACGRRLAYRSRTD